MSKLALSILTCGSVLIVLANLFGGPAGEWALALASIGFPIGLILLASGRIPRRRPLWGYLAVLALIMGISAAALLLLSTHPGPPEIFGVPPATLIMLGGLALVPLLLVIWAHAATFGDRGPSR